MAASPNPYIIRANMQFSLTTASIKPIIDSLEKSLAGKKINLPVNLTINKKITSQLTEQTGAFRALNASINLVKNSSEKAAINLQLLSAALGSVKANFVGLNTGVKSFSTATNQLNQTTSSAQKLNTEIEKGVRNSETFAGSVGVSARRFSAFVIAASAFSAVTLAIGDGVKQALEFDRELVRLKQVGGDTASQIKSIANEVTRLSTTLGVSSSDLVKAASTFKQAGYSARETKLALEALAETTLSPTFDNIANTQEGMIAIMAQFGKGADALRGQLGALSKVSADFAAESSDLIEGVKRAGAAFVGAGGDLNELFAIFTSIRSTTRESAESIATGLRTIIARLQDPKISQSLKQIGINLYDLQGNFIGPFKAAEKLHDALINISPKNVAFSSVLKEIGGLRNLSRALPLITEFPKAQEALKSALSGQGVLAKDAATAQAAFLTSITKLKEQFLELFRIISNDTTVRAFMNVTIQALTGVNTALKEMKGLIPVLTVFGGLRLASGLIQGRGQFAKGFQNPRGYAQGDIVRDPRDTVPAWLQPGEFVFPKRAAQNIGYNNLRRQVKNASYGAMLGAFPGMAKGDLRGAAFGAAGGIFGSIVPNAADKLKNAGMRTYNGAAKGGLLGGLLGFLGAKGYAEGDEIFPGFRIPSKYLPKKDPLLELSEGLEKLYPTKKRPYVGDIFGFSDYGNPNSPENKSFHKDVSSQAKNIIQSQKQPKFYRHPITGQFISKALHEKLNAPVFGSSPTGIPSSLSSVSAAQSSLPGFLGTPTSYLPPTFGSTPTGIPRNTSPIVTGDLPGFMGLPSAYLPKHPSPVAPFGTNPTGIPRTLTNRKEPVPQNIPSLGLPQHYQNQALNQLIGKNQPRTRFVPPIPSNNGSYDFANGFGNTYDLADNQKTQYAYTPSGFKSEASERRFYQGSEDIRLSKLAARQAPKIEAREHFGILDSSFQRPEKEITRSRFGRLKDFYQDIKGEEQISKYLGKGGTSLIGSPISRPFKAPIGFGGSPLYEQIGGTFSGKANKTEKFFENSAKAAKETAQAIQNSESQSGVASQTLKKSRFGIKSKLAAGALLAAGLAPAISNYLAPSPNDGSPKAPGGGRNQHATTGALSGAVSGGITGGFVGGPYGAVAGALFGAYTGATGANKESDEFEVKNRLDKYNNNKSRITFNRYGGLTKEGKTALSTSTASALPSLDILRSREKEALDQGNFLGKADDAILAVTNYIISPFTNRRLGDDKKSSYTPNKSIKSLIGLYANEDEKTNISDTYLDLLKKQKEANPHLSNKDLFANTPGITTAKGEKISSKELLGLKSGQVEKFEAWVKSVDDNRLIQEKLTAIEGQATSAFLFTVNELNEFSDRLHHAGEQFTNQSTYNKQLYGAVNGNLSAGPSNLNLGNLGSPGTTAGNIHAFSKAGGEYDKAKQQLASIFDSIQGDKASPDSSTIAIKARGAFTAGGAYHDQIALELQKLIEDPDELDKIRKFGGAEALEKVLQRAKPVKDANEHNTKILNQVYAQKQAEEIDILNKRRGIDQQRSGISGEARSRIAENAVRFNSTINPSYGVEEREIEETRARQISNLKETNSEILDYDSNVNAPGTQIRKDRLGQIQQQLQKKHLTKLERGALTRKSSQISKEIEEGSALGTNVGFLSKGISTGQVELAKLQSKRQDAIDSGKSVEEIKALDTEINKMADQLARLGSALENAAKDTSNLEAAQKSFNLAISRKEADTNVRKNLAHTLTFGSRQDQMELFQKENLVQQATQLSAEQFQMLPDQIRSAVGEHLQNTQGLARTIGFDRRGRPIIRNSQQIEEHLIRTNLGGLNNDRGAKLLEARAAIAKVEFEQASKKRFEDQSKLIEIQAANLAEQNAKLNAGFQVFLEGANDSIKKQIEGANKFLANSAELTKALAGFPKEIIIERSGKVEVILNGAATIEALKGDFRNEIFKDIIKAIEMEAKKKKLDDRSF